MLLNILQYTEYSPTPCPTKVYLTQHVSTALWHNPTLEVINKQSQFLFLINLYILAGGREENNQWDILKSPNCSEDGISLKEREQVSYLDPTDTWTLVGS